MSPPDPAALRATALALEEPDADRLLSALETPGVEVELPPRPGLVLARVTDAFDCDFHVGEVLVTEAGVRAGDRRGWGVTVGDAPRRALLLAVLDLLGAAGDAATLARAEALLAPEAARQAEARRREAALVAGTRVAFEPVAGH